MKKKGRLPEVDDTNCGKRVKKSVFDSFNSLLCKTNIPMNILFEEKGLFLTKGESNDQEKKDFGLFYGWLVRKQKKIVE